jgi:magnesium-transporting ATPase (P-type)
MDDNFASIVKTVMWGRAVYDNIRKFVQFQLTVNCVALTLSLIAAFLDGLEKPLTAVQLLWVNLIMDTLAALALATEMPTDALLERRPYSRDTHLISYSMWRFVLVHAFFLLIILMVLLTKGEDWLDLKDASNFDDEGERNETLMCIIFNTFVWMQIFNEINARKVNGEWNVVEGFFDNWLFSGILALTAILQTGIVEGGGEFTNTVPLDATQWAFCVVVGTVSFPISQLTLWIPVDMEQGMVDVDSEWFYRNQDFIDGKHTDTVQAQTASHK